MLAPSGQGRVSRSDTDKRGTRSKCEGVGEAWKGEGG